LIQAQGHAYNNTIGDLIYIYYNAREKMIVGRYRKPLSKLSLGRHKLKTFGNISANIK